MTVHSMPYRGISLKRAEWQKPVDFTCRKPEFAAYLEANAAYDQQQRMGQMYWAIHGGRVVGYMVLAMDSLGKELQPLLGIDTYGNIPALLVASLATDKRHEGRGVATFLLSHATKIANNLASRVGCRILLCNAEHDVVRFYEKFGFVIVSEHEGHVPMYFDLGETKPSII